MAPWWQFARLPGIGPVLAQRITELATADARWGDPHRRAYEKATDLLRVRGIGEKTLARLAPFLRFDPPGTESRPAGTIDNRSGRS
ncbi:MAG: helix-hairpin-helix domain-containing protein [Phycisphaerae bacterium]|nr:helix-hairpin-helix domain-containing protein [Phycisphaerae bacterium]